MRRPEALVFDWDNTLVESWKTIHDAWNATLRDFGREEVTLAETKARVRLSAKEGFAEIFATDTERAICLYRKYYQSLHTVPEPVDGVETLLKFCQQNTIPCGVISNKSHDFLQREIAQLQWQNYFPFGALGAGQASADKPDPAALYSLLPTVSDYTDYWYIGDTGVDLEFAHRTGMIGVLVGDNITMKDRKPTKHFVHFSDLLIELKDFSYE